ncbi:MAG: hypothetical protein WAN34_07995 [Acidimicrobiia bacterium]
MPSEMRRPGPVNIQTFVSQLDLRLRDEVPRTPHTSLPTFVHRVVKDIRAFLAPVLQSGAMVLTSLAIIVAVGVAPGTLSAPDTGSAVLSAPSAPRMFSSEPHDFLDRIPEDEFLASEAVQVADNPDTPTLGME